MCRAMEMCRVCLTTEKDLIALDDIFIENYNLLTNLNITTLDGMPQVACRACVNMVKSFIDFRDKCIASETTLREVLLGDVKSENVTLNIEPTKLNEALKNIKVEVKDENEDSVLLNTLREIVLKEAKSQNEKLNSIEIHNSTNLKDLNTIKVELEPDEAFLSDKDYDVYDHYDDGLEDYIVKKDGRKCQKTTKKKNKKKDIKVEKLIKNTSDSESKLACGLCPKSFDEKIDLNEHLENHKNDRRCGLCTEVANSLSQLLAHRLAHIPINQLKCHICAKRYKVSLYLEHHYRNQHIEEDSPHLSCKFCSVACATPKKLNSHVLQMHTALKYFCDECGKGYHTKSNLRAHIKRHNSRKMFVCDMCGFSCKHNGGLKDHKIRKHNPMKVYCKNCKRPFAGQEEHDKHKCKSVDRICTICGIRVPGTSRLARHMQVHSKEARYACPRCPSRYRSRGALAVHLDRHDGNKTKRCEYCSAKFYNASVLIKHRRIHTGEKPYVCKVCNKGFTGNNNLKVHMKVHGEYLINKKNGDKEDINK